MIYRILTIITFVLTASGGISGQSHRNLDEVVVTGKRSMKDIGIQRTSFDSMMLKENISLSMADILAFNSALYVKNYGRATLSTVSFRGTSPSHTKVLWNGMKINSPMLGMTDFSTIPSYFIDNASLLHGASSVNEAGGGLGGMVSLNTSPVDSEGIGLQYVQGIGSFKTFDEFLRFSYGSEKWQSTTRFVYSSSPNDYKYVNHDKKLNIYDDNHNIIGQYHPVERNRNGAYKDMHLLQEVYFNSLKGDRVGMNIWLSNLDRELPMISTDYGYDSDYINKQHELTLRTVLSWKHNRSTWSTDVRAGYLYTKMSYDYRREVTEGNWADMTRSRSRVNTLFGQIEGEFKPHDKWYFSASVSGNQYFVRSEDKNIITQNGQDAVVGYDKARIELSASASAKWRPSKRIGLSVVARGEMFGDRWAPVIPAFFFDGLLSEKGGLMFKASVSRNYRFPSLNDMYFLPGGNPDLKSESGFDYDAGLSFSVGELGRYKIDGGVTWFDSYIDNWILWLPTTKGFFTPRNVKKVHSYGVEAKLNSTLRISKGWQLDINGSYSWTPSINRGDKISSADQSIGKQLPYVPRHSASVTGRLSWNRWSFLYKWNFYSERYTMSSNDVNLSGTLPPYYMNNIALEKMLVFSPADLSLRLAVNNLFNEEYISVLSRPMPGINFEFYISITPKFRQK